MKNKQLYLSNKFFYQAIMAALTELKEQEPDKFIELFYLLPENLSITKIGWLKDEIGLKLFYNLLIKHEFVCCDFAFCRIHFEGEGKPQSKIIWQANLNELVYLFARLREEGIIPLHKNPHILLQDNFLDKYEKPIKSQSLRTLLEKGIKNSNRVELIDDIIDTVLSEKIK